MRGPAGRDRRGPAGGRWQRPAAWTERLADQEAPRPRLPLADERDAVFPGPDAPGRDRDERGSLAGARQESAPEHLEVGDDDDVALPLVEVGSRQLPLVVGERVGEPNLVVY